MNPTDQEDNNKSNLLQMGLFDLGEHLAREETEQYQTVSTTSDNVLKAILALDSIKGIGIKTLYKLFDVGVFEHLWETDIAQIAELWRQIPDKPKIELPEIIGAKKAELREVAEKCFQEMRAKGISFVPFGDPNYPKNLHRLEYAPRWIFVQGNVQILKSDSIAAIVGTREPSKEGESLAYLCASQFVQKNFVVLSGLAKGIDENAHKGAIDYFGLTIGVLGHGISEEYSSYNREIAERILDREGAIVSEYFPSDPPSRERFLRRNELQAALSQILVPIELHSLNSGTGATIRRAQSLRIKIVGVTPEKSSEPSIQGTLENLQRSGYSSYKISSDMESEFWRHLHILLPNHDWSGEQTDRQDRFFRALIKYIGRYSKYVSLDDRAIDRFASYLKGLNRFKGDGGTQ